MIENKVKTKGLNFVMLTSLVTGTMIGSGIYTLPANLAAYGSISMLGWCLTAMGAVFLAFIFAKLSSFMPKAGGPYAYCKAAFGSFIGFEVAYHYWIALSVGNAAIVVTCIGYLAHFLPVLKTKLWLSFIIKIALIWLFTGVNLLGVRSAAILQVVSIFLKCLPLLLISAVGFFYIQGSNYQAFNVSGESNFSALGITAALALWSFIGLEAATVPADDVKNKKHIASATIIGTLIAAIINLICIISIMGLIPANILAASSAPFTDAAKILFPSQGEWIGSIISLGAIIACLGTLNSSILLQGQIAQASAKDGLFPAFLAKKNSKGAPSKSLIISAVIITLLLFLTINDTLLKQFELMILIATFASLVPYFITALAAMILIKEKPKLIISTIAFLASLYSAWAILSVGKTILICGLFTFLSGIIIYLCLRYSYGWLNTLASEN
jgi:basic amino acid/polyamine antiporter, APA family